MVFADLINRHAGLPCWVFGTGKSLDAVADAEIVGPRIFLNRTAFALPASAGETYWLVADDAWSQAVKGPWWEWLGYVRDGSAKMTGAFRSELMNGAKLTPAPTGRNIVHWGGGPREERPGLRRLSREQIASRGTLYQWVGTASPAIHLAWFMGASKVILVGVDGTDGFADRVMRFYDKPKRGGFGYGAARECAIGTAQALGVEVEDRTAAYQKVTA